MLLVSYGCGKLMAGESEEGEVFEYRDIYLPPYNSDNNKKYDLHDVDDAWGIWGHNLSNVLPENPSHQVFMKHDGGYHKEQFCFSSPKLYEYIVDFIHNKYLFTDSLRFAILPNDNELVCLCDDCIRLGNTEGNAAPAVMSMIEKLAKKFPQHKFFTSHYSTTSQLPEREMPANTGVIVSAMEYPLSAAETPKEKEFLQILDQWKSKTDRIYIWDYVNNFDDYFTPFPVFTVMQRRLKNYRDLGVTGVFFNGSGDDYSTFGELKKAVLAEMLQNPDIDWKEVLRSKALEFYPNAGNDISDFIIAQEEMVEKNGKKLPLYEGVEAAIRIYLPEKKFVDFYNKIVKHKKTATGSELNELEMMTDAMAMTMLELKRINNDIDDTSKLKERLGRLIKNNDIEFYNEGCWSIDEYLRQYEFLEQQAQESANSNLLKNVKLIARTPLDEDYSDIRILTDGHLGIPSNYHNGNLISSADPALQIGIPRQPGMKKLRVWMVYNPAFKIGLPEEVSLLVGGARIKTLVPEKPKGGTEHSMLEFDVPADGEIVLSLKKNPEIKTMALDEIEAF